MNARIEDLNFPAIGGQTEENREIEPEYLAIDNMLAGLGGSSDATVVICKEGPGGYKDLTVLTECLPSEFSMARLQNEFGGGNFRIHVRADGRILANRGIKVAPPAGSAVPSLALSPVMSKIDSLADSVAKLAGIVAGPGSGGSRKEFLEEMMLMQKMFASAPAAAAAVANDPFKSVMDALKIHQALSGLSGGVGEQGPVDGMAVLMKAVESFSGPIAEYVSMMKARQSGPGMQDIPPDDQQDVQQNPVPALESGQMAPAPTPTQSEESDPMQDRIKMFVEMVIYRAANNLDPMVPAMLLTEEVDEAEINAMLRPETWWMNLCALDPRIAQYKEWFTELRESVFGILTEDNGTDTNGGNSPVESVQNATIPATKPARNKHS